MPRKNCSKIHAFINIRNSIQKMGIIIYSDVALRLRGIYHISLNARLHSEQ
jgi:hypothetical protein